MTSLTPYNFQYLLLSEYLKDRVREELEHLEDVRQCAIGPNATPEEVPMAEAYLELLVQDRGVMALLCKLTVEDHSKLLTSEARQSCIVQLERELKGAAAAGEPDVCTEISSLIRKLKSIK